MQLQAQAEQCINAWHSETAQHLHRLLQAEQLCPAQEPFEALRLKLQNLVNLNSNDGVVDGQSQENVMETDKQQRKKGAAGGLQKPQVSGTSIVDICRQQKPQNLS